MEQIACFHFNSIMICICWVACALNIVSRYRIFAVTTIIAVCIASMRITPSGNVTAITMNNGGNETISYSNHCGMGIEATWFAVLTLLERTQKHNVELHKRFQQGSTVWGPQQKFRVHQKIATSATSTMDTAMTTTTERRKLLCRGRRRSGQNVAGVPVVALMSMRNLWHEDFVH